MRVRVGTLAQALQCAMTFLQVAAIIVEPIVKSCLEVRRRLHVIRLRQRIIPRTAAPVFETTPKPEGRASQPIGLIAALREPMRLAVQRKRLDICSRFIRNVDIAPIQHVAELVQRFRMFAKRRLFEQLQCLFGILFTQTSVFVDVTKVHRGLRIAEAQALLVELSRRLEAPLVIGGKPVVVKPRADIQRQAAALLAVARFVV